MDVKRLNKIHDSIRKSVEKVIGSAITNGAQLDALAKLILGSRYRGIYQANEKLPKLKPGEGVIINKPIDEHWIVQFKLNNGSTYLYDSFNRHSFIKPYRDADFDHKPDQSTTEANCGQRSLSRLIMAVLFDV